MNVNAANEDMLSESELKKKKKLPLGGEGERRREREGWRMKGDRRKLGDQIKKNSVGTLEDSESSAV